MRVLKTIAAMALALTLTACGAKTVDCSAGDAQSTMISLLQDQIVKSAVRQSTSDDGQRVATDAKIRATVALLRISLSDIRTTKEDPNSTKRFCVATARITVPVNIIDDATRVRELADLPTVDRMATGANLERDADAYTYSIEYNVQPTDDGKKVYAEIDRGSDQQLDFFGDLVASSLVRRTFEANKAAEAAAADMQAAQEAQAQHASLQADLDLAAAENKLSKQYLNQMWSLIPQEAQARYTPLQTAWVSKKVADCNLEAANESADPLGREAARLRCDTRLNRTRAEQLRPLTE